MYANSTRRKCYYLDYFNSNAILDSALDIRVRENSGELQECPHQDGLQYQASGLEVVLNKDQYLKHLVRQSHTSTIRRSSSLAVSGSDLWPLWSAIAVLYRGYTRPSASALAPPLPVLPAVARPASSRTRETCLSARL